MQVCAAEGLRLGRCCMWKMCTWSPVGLQRQRRGMQRLHSAAPLSAARFRVLPSGDEFGEQHQIDCICCRRHACAAACCYLPPERLQKYTSRLIALDCISLDCTVYTPIEELQLRPRWLCSCRRALASPAPCSSSKALQSGPPPRRMQKLQWWRGQHRCSKSRRPPPQPSAALSSQLPSLPPRSSRSLSTRRVESLARARLCSLARPTSRCGRGGGEGDGRVRGGGSGLLFKSPNHVQLCLLDPPPQCPLHPPTHIPRARTSTARTCSAPTSPRPTPATPTSAAPSCRC